MRVMKNKTLFESFQENLKEYDKKINESNTIAESDEEFESYDDFTDGDIVRDIIENFKTITGKDVKEIFNYEDRGNDSEGFFKEDAINETAVSIGEYLKEKGLSQNRIDEIYYKLDEVLSGMWQDYVPSDLNEAFNLDDAVADVTEWAESMYKGSEINSSTISSLLNSKEELKDKYTENQKEKIVKWFEDEEAKYMPFEAINEGIALDSIKDIDNDIINQSPKLIQQAIDNSDLPEDKKMKLYNIINPLVNDEIEYDKEAKEKLVAVLEEADETVRVVTTQREERDYAITDITELNEIADGDVQPPIDITGLLVEVDNRLTESYGDWGQINFQSTRFNVDTKDSNALFELRVGDKNYLMSMLLEENGSLLRVNNTDGKTIYKAKSKDVLSLAESYIKQFIPKQEEIPECLVHINQDLHDRLDFIKAYIELYKSAPKESKDELKEIVQRDIYSFITELSTEIKATEPTEDDKLELPTFDAMVEEVFGKEWVKEEQKENKLELDGVETLKESDTYIFNTKFASDEDRNGQECELVKDYGNGQILIKFTKDGKELKVYDNEIKLKEAEDPIKDDVKNDLGIEPGSDEEAALDALYDEPSGEITEDPKGGLGTGYAQFYRKPKDINVIESGANTFTSGKASYIICSKEKLTDEEFNKLQDDFLAPNQYCKSFEPLDVENYSYNVIEFSCDQHNYTLLVDPSGYDYCRYVAKIGGTNENK